MDRPTQMQFDTRLTKQPLPPLHLVLPAIPEAAAPEIAWTFAYGADRFKQELRETCARLGYRPIFHSIGLQNYSRILDGIPADEMLFYLCDGNETDDQVCGLTPVRLLEAQGRRFIGSGSAFWQNTTCKARMKRLFVAHGVPTPRYQSFSCGDAVRLEPDRTYPLFVKPAVLYGSVGVSDASVLLSEAVAQTQIAAVLEQFGSALVEEFIVGREFTVVVLGDGEVFAMAERRFAPHLGPLQRFISYERSWVDLASSYAYHAVTDAGEGRKLADAATAAFRAVGGDQYARVDIRRREATGDVFVLEVNSMPSICEESSVGDCVRVSGRTMPELLDRIIHQSRSAALVPCCSGSIRRMK